MIEKIKNWAEERRLLGEFRLEQEVTNLMEEIIEMITDKESEEAKILARDIIKLIRNGNMRYVINKNRDIVNEKEIYEIEEERIIDAAMDLVVFAIQIPYKLGYDTKCSMEETIKEISSREQDKEQKERWEKYGSNGEKWIKDKSEEAKKKWYKAKYNKCKSN